MNTIMMTIIDEELKEELLDSGRTEPLVAVAVVFSLKVAIESRLAD